MRGSGDGTRAERAIALPEHELPSARVILARLRAVVAAFPPAVRQRHARLCALCNERHVDELRRGGRAVQVPGECETLPGLPLRERAPDMLGAVANGFDQPPAFVRLE